MKIVTISVFSCSSGDPLRICYVEDLSAFRCVRVGVLLCIVACRGYCVVIWI